MVARGDRPWTVCSDTT
ncbi:hypothetical protein DNTS_030907 [Danionella cerebrum]|uniref:Uncharacterized protein n=1 Tax=Danionella cerebrum TaxID=2873325 RepID=A0A553Q9X8_9TELE|nr:hypothetical protein DNTS_029015 [Danionella translucida]TRZ03899.1 hypothetical protein DNTS_030907 [Danionella translucida]